MVQWVNRLRNNIFVNAPPLPLLCGTSGALHLAQLGLTAGWQAGWLADKIQKISKFKVVKAVALKTLCKRPRKVSLDPSL